MYYIITENKVHSYKTYKELQRKSSMIVPQDDFVPHGSDKVIFINKKDIDFCQDAKKLSTMAMARLFKQDPLPKTFFYIMLALQIFIFMRG